MDEEEKEALWAEVENIAFNAIRDIAVVLDKLPMEEKENIHRKLDSIASEGVRLVYPQKLH